MAAGGQTKAHLLHWMQIGGSQEGISRAIARFSHCAVAVGQVPSTGKAETGRRSPLPSIITEMMRWTKSGASFGTTARTLPFPGRAPRGTSERVSMVACKGERRGPGAKRRCEIVIAPDFLES